ncbi:MAG: beta-lactamase family protein [Proteobacteria bacterium]|nr:beta-lactamase family protein [Pseudomonadota bacterium]
MLNPALSRRSLLRGAGLAGAGAGIAALPFAPRLAQAATAAKAQAGWPAVTALVNKYVDAGEVPGMIAALGWRDNPPEYIARGREGFDDHDPDSAGSLFRAYSMTKPVTGMAAMMLIEDGKLKLDQPLADFAPEFAKMQVAIDPHKGLEARPAQTQITIRHLLTHTAGLGYAGVNKDKVSNELKRLGVNAGIVSNLPMPGINDGAPTPDQAEFLRRTATVPLVSEPGARWRYSMGLDVLGIVIARIAGTPSLAEFLHQRLFMPLGMTSSFFTVPETALSRLTTNYALMGGVPLPIDRPLSSVYRHPPFAFGGSGLVTSPADYDRFLAMIVNGGKVKGKRVIGEAAVRLATSNLLPPGADIKDTWVADYDFGAGALVGRGKDAGLFGWSGAAGTVGFAQTRLGLRTGLFVQYMPQEVLPVLKEFPQAVASDLKARGLGA